ncbi:MAG TPA: lysylphosphatidylglycerol synthase transmembrane domain-containing protein, partial [Thermomicrobiales bacterium]|nr:lysylphosphatidylglycerol synthase transmembrane domain-containing protein [Thermomicrobiales bacterium]
MTAESNRMVSTDSGPTSEVRPESSPPEELDGTPPDSLGKRFLNLRTLVSFGVAIAVLYVVFRGLGIDIGDAWGRMRQANRWMFAGALVSFYLTFVVRAWRWTRMLDRVGINPEHGYPVPGLPGMYQIILLSWFANCVVPARLGDAYRGFLLKARTGASFGMSFGTILAERLIDLVVLVSVLFVSGLIVFGTHAPNQAEKAFLFGGGIVLLGVIGIIALWLLRDHIERMLPIRLMTHYRRLNKGLFQVLARPTPFALMSVALWLSDGLRVYLIAWSLNQHISYQAAIMVALVSALVSVVPFTPAGLGFVEGFMVTALTQIGVPSGAAAAIALLDRVVTYLSLIVV